ncbi:hypothetical protein CMI37_38675 [Candidatus Pacearchaeota archaeon]|jgi:hypothetical protein|nr:hypothetical protein [Candidatus Pacearchaeota archaeon]|tara:strand:- start:451 stop:825 length:375 start_codon:yes stop_codon:yes gene_type:complete
MTRGIKHEVDRFVNDMSAQYYPYEINKQNHYVQLAMRPIQLWEMVFPKDALQSVMRTLWDETQPNVNMAKGIPLKVIAKTLGAKKIPNLDMTMPKRIIYKDNVAIYPVGTRNDKFADEDGHEIL